MNREKTKLLTRAALFGALVYLLTLTGAVAPIGGGAYIHIGDAMIYIVSVLLPLPSALMSAVIGAALADITLGSAIYVIPTVIIKALMVICIKVTVKLVKKTVIRDLLICAVGLITVVGYYFAEVVLLLISGSEFVAALVTGASNSVIYNTVQMLASAAVYMLASGIVFRLASKRKEQE